MVSETGMWNWYVKLVCETGMWNWYVKLVCEMWNWHETGMWNWYVKLRFEEGTNLNVKWYRSTTTVLMSMAPLDSRLTILRLVVYRVVDRMNHFPTRCCELSSSYLNLASFVATSLYNCMIPVCCWTICINTYYLIVFFCFNRFIKYHTTTKMVIIVNCRHHGGHRRRRLQHL